MIIRPQPKAFFLHALMYLFMYGMFCAAVAVVIDDTASYTWIALTLFVWGAPVILLRCFFANNNSFGELFKQNIVIRQGVFGWSRTFLYEDLAKVTVEYSPLFGKSLWYAYFYTKKAAKKRFGPYSAALVGISESDARNVITTMTEHDVEVDVNGLIMSPKLAK